MVTHDYLAITPYSRDNAYSCLTVIAGLNRVTGSERHYELRAVATLPPDDRLAPSFALRGLKQADHVEIDGSIGEAVDRDVMIVAQVRIARRGFRHQLYLLLLSRQRTLRISGPFLPRLG